MSGTHFIYGSGFCAHCGALQALYRKGTVYRHFDYRTPNRDPRIVTCPGSMKPPMEPPAGE